jgi:hypothetical protein
MFTQGLERRKWIIALVSVLFVLAGCVCSLLAGTSILVARASAPGMGVPVTSGNWQVTVNSAHEESAVLDFDNDVHTPKSSYTLVIVDVTLRNLDPSQETKVSNDAFVLIDAAGGTIESIGLGDSKLGKYGLGSYSMSNDESDVLKDVAIVFVVEKSKMRQALKLQFQDGPRIALAVNQK